MNLRRKWGSYLRGRFKGNSQWRSANTFLEGIARTERQAPAVRAILKQTPSPVRGLSLGLWKWEWDWTVQPCWKYPRSTFFSPWMLQMPQIGPGVCWEQWQINVAAFHQSCLQATPCASFEVQTGESPGVSLSQHCMERLIAAQPYSLNTQQAYLHLMWLWLDAHDRLINESED